MIIAIENAEGKLLLFDTRSNELYEGIISPETKINDPAEIKKVKELATKIIESKTPSNVKERSDAYDPELPLSHLDDIITNYYEYELLVTEFKKYAEEHYIPTITKLYKLFDEIVKNLNYKINGGCDGTTTWKLSDRVKIMKSIYDGEGYIGLSFTGITPGYWETYTPETIREYLETLASKRKKIEKIYTKLAEEYPAEIDMNEVKKVIKTLEIFRKLVK